VVVAVAQLALLAGCSLSSTDVGEASAVQPQGRTGTGRAPERFTIRPDDFHIPYAGTAEDGRKFFLSEELFADSNYVGLFLWRADGTFDEVRVNAVPRPKGLPPAQAAPAGATALIDERLDELGDYVLEPIEVEPFTTKVHGVTFGWRVSRFRGIYTINVEPGDFIAYYEPWDGRGYDT
jgi:hypothetical protein